jgi:hypothetical protein
LGTCWQDDYWDRFIRDERHFEAAVGCIDRNPVKRACERADRTAVGKRTFQHMSATGAARSQQRAVSETMASDAIID